MNTYRTAQIASRVNIHPNTVRLYEELGYLPPVPRASNGYRCYNQLHLEHLRLVRSALRSTWLGGVIRKKALLVIKLAAMSRINEALEVAQDHLALIVTEREKAELAAAYLEIWAASNQDEVRGAVPQMNSGEVRTYVNITYDMLRSWERNGLITIPRDPQNGYRVFGELELQRLYVIRALRKARFSLMSIYHMFQHYDHGERERLTRILNDLPAEEEDIFFNTNQWLTKIKTIEASAEDILQHLHRITDLHKL